MTGRDSSAPASVNAAGAVVWRRRSGQLQVLLVHRGRYDDWSWPKGKLDPGETWTGAAVREVEEETGLRVRLGVPVVKSVYPLRGGQLKQVHYWAAQAVGGSGALEHEIDQVAWLSPAAARTRMSYPRDVLQLQNLLEAEQAQTLDTWPLLIVRHAEARPRSRWRGEDGDRPLNTVGKRRSRRLVPVLDAFGVQQLVSSCSLRCTDTVRPYADAAGVRLRTRKGLSEEGFEAAPSKAPRQVEKALEAGTAIALCSHRPVLPSMLARLAEQAADVPTAQALQALAEEGMWKGEALVAHVAGTGPQARVVAIERHVP